MGGHKLDFAKMMREEMARAPVVQEAPVIGEANDEETKDPEPEDPGRRVLSRTPTAKTPEPEEKTRRGPSEPHTDDEEETKRTSPPRSPSRFTESMARDAAALLTQ